VQCSKATPKEPKEYPSFSLPFPQEHLATLDFLPKIHYNFIFTDNQVRLVSFNTN